MNPKPLNLTTLVLIRHATACYDRNLVPPENPPLDETATHDYTATAAALPPDKRWIVSPLERCRKTADNLLAHGATASVRLTDPDIREQSYGQWHGQPIADIWKRHLAGAPKHDWHFLHPEITPEGGESFADVMRRIEPTIRALSDEDTVLIGHGMVIRALIGLALGLAPAQALALDIAPLSVSALTSLTSARRDASRWRLDYLNRIY